MLKEVEKPINETRVEGVKDFIIRFNLKTQFKKEYGCSIEDWDYGVPDQKVIEGMLGKLAQVWACRFENFRNDGHFIIEQYEDTKGNINEAIAILGDIIAWVSNHPENPVKHIHTLLLQALIKLKGE